ncbi:unnamed protein product, partial [Meganyctiphanes norvegica]
MDLTHDFSHNGSPMAGSSSSQPRSLSVSDLCLAPGFSQTVNMAILNGDYDSNLNRENILNLNHSGESSCNNVGAAPRKSYSLPHRYKPQGVSGWRGGTTPPNPNPTISPIEFKHQFTKMRQWFNTFTDEQKNRVLAELLEHIGPSQLHFLSCAIGPRLHEGCPHNCQDPIAWLPPGLGLTIFSYLDPVSLALASQVCR